jgi:RNA polymerase sigma-70 factor, ECF subfamily
VLFLPLVIRDSYKIMIRILHTADWAIEAHDPINEMLKQLYQMINQLGQLDKSIILLYLEDKSYEEIAEITGLTVTNVATKLSRIKDKLKRMKKEE